MKVVINVRHRQLRPIDSLFNPPEVFVANSWRIREMLVPTLSNLAYLMLTLPRIVRILGNACTTSS